MLYKTAAGYGEKEQIIERSRFIAYVQRAETREEADAFIESIRKKHRDATHNVPAIVIGDRMQLQWASDDGEPQGTSGAPIVQMLVKEGITNVVIVVTRYFGGIKLGTGGLVRAYTSSAKLGLEAAGLAGVFEMSVFDAKFGYQYLDRVQNFARNEKYEIRDIKYEDAVTVGFAAEPEREDALRAFIADATGGTAEISDARTERVTVRLD